MITVILLVSFKTVILLFEVLVSCDIYREMTGRFD